MTRESTRVTTQGYSEAELVKNRAALLLYGGSAADRRAWAEEAQRGFEQEGALVEAAPGPSLDAALALTRGVVFVPDAAALSYPEQGKVVRLLQEREERPKLVLGLADPPAALRDRGLLREDLLYRLAIAQVDLSNPETREAIRDRRAKAAKEAARAPKPKPKPKPKSKPKPKPKPSARKPAKAKTAARRPPAKAKARKKK